MSSPSKLGLAAAIGLPIAVVASMLMVFLLVVAPGAAACGAGQGSRANPNAVPAEPIAGYSGEQLKNAAYIMNAAIDLGLDRQAQVLGVMTAMGESSLRVINYGDEAGPDSRGLFQQRDSWGSLADRMDPTTSAALFFQRLMTVEGWQQLTPTLAIHKVQRNADPFHYERFQDAAEKVVSALAGASGQCAGGDLRFPLSPGYNMTDDYGPRPDTGVGASTWHPAVDLQHSPNPCGDPVHAIQTGTVTLAINSQVSIKHPDGYTISYLHMRIEDTLVKAGDKVTPGQQIGAVGNEGQSTGCHLDLRVNVAGNTNSQIATLQLSQALGGPRANFVNPEEFYKLFGLELCPPDSCARRY
ncbi:M23 family metallopeptidase [Agromyces sp. GXS1127]|uniref:M23 family metallopeptidase n=1 Tax=Agromyces sp. GXS1127 TaxID=3424181 RepID=UPI003D32141C